MRRMVGDLLLNLGAGVAIVVIRGYILCLSGRLSWLVIYALCLRGLLGGDAGGERVMLTFRDSWFKMTWLGNGRMVRAKRPKTDPVAEVKAIKQRLEVLRRDGQTVTGTDVECW